jgi:hypothetical protein
MSKVLLRDGDWTIVDGLMCTVSHFTPFAKVERGRVVSADRKKPYAEIALECTEGGTKLPSDTVGAITHKLDFKHLWAAFIERGINDDEIVVIVWGKKYLKRSLKMVSPFMPRLIVTIFKAEAYKLLRDKSYKPELRGEARYLAELPTAEWRPEALR